MSEDERKEAVKKIKEHLGLTIAEGEAKAFDDEMIQMFVKIMNMK
jgi:hypothetical protein